MGVVGVVEGRGGGEVVEGGRLSLLLRVGGCCVVRAVVVGVGWSCLEEEKV